MPLSKDALKLRKLIEKVIADNKITPHEQDLILTMAGADGHIDKHEQALLDQLHEMIANGTVKVTR